MELDGSVRFGKKGIISAAADIGSRMYSCSPLAGNDRTGFYKRPARSLNSKVFGIGIPAVFCAASAAFSCHLSPPYRQFAILGVFLGDRRNALDQEHPGGGKKILSIRRIIGLHKEEARFRSVMPYRYALSAGKGANRSPHQNRNSGADNIGPCFSGPRVAASPAGTQYPVFVQNRFYINQL
jgi:hypothetical protein